MKLIWERIAKEQLKEVAKYIMVYYVDDNEIIHISAFWDCRRNPEAQAKLVK